MNSLRRAAWWTPLACVAVATVASAVQAGDGHQPHQSRTYMGGPNSGPYQQAPKYRNPWAGRVFGFPFVCTPEDRYERFLKDHQIIQARYLASMNRLDWKAQQGQDAGNTTAGLVAQCNCNPNAEVARPMSLGEMFGKNCGAPGCGLLNGGCTSCGGSAGCASCGDGGCADGSCGSSKGCSSCNASRSGWSHKAAGGCGSCASGGCADGSCDGHSFAGLWGWKHKNGNPGHGKFGGSAAPPVYNPYQPYPQMNREDAVRYLEGTQYYPPYQTIRSPRDFYMFDVKYGIGQ
ncbi:MAG: hypothetical protein ACRC1K_00455 [Planctomycetia bacterium]